MRPSELRQRLSEGLLDFAWDEWAQMGVLASPRRHSQWARDPEALVVFTLEIARDDPRLFDEALDWIAQNQHLLSTYRLRAMCVDDEDRALVDGALGWVASTRGRRVVPSPVKHRPARLLFRGLSEKVADPDPSFKLVGLLRSVTQTAGTARPPDVRIPSNLAFRLRQLLGVGVRAEIVRCLLTAETEAVTAQSVTRAAGFSGRNVREALLALNDAGVVVLLGGGREQRYAVNRENWMRLLAIDPGELPAQQDWPQLLKGLRLLLRWLTRPDLDSLSEYLLGSEAIEILEQVRDDFKQTGIPVDEVGAADAWRVVEGLVDRALWVLGVAHDLGPSSDAGPSMLPGLGVYRDKAGGYGWRFVDPDHHERARSAGTFSTEQSAMSAASRFIRLVERWRYEIYLDKDGGSRWRAKASDGDTVAVSPGSFGDRRSADRDVVRLLGLLAG